MADTKITEKYEYKTDIITAYDGTEQRIKTRQYPRHTLTYDYSAMEIDHSLYLRGVMRMRHSDLYYVPMWHDVAYLSEDFVENGKLLYINPIYMYNFDEVEYIEIFKNDDVYQSGTNLVKQVDHYVDGGIALKKKIKEPLDMRNTWIYPLRQCFTQPTSGLNYVFSNGSEVGQSFEDTNKPSKIHIPSKYRWNYDYDLPQKNRWHIQESYNDVEVFTKTPEWVDDQDVSLSIDKNIVRMDNDTGTVIYDLINTKSIDIHTYNYTFRTQPQIHNIKKFFKRVAGSWQSFYMPSWVNDFPICRDIMATDPAIYIKYTKLYQFYVSNDRKKAIIVFTKDWQAYIFEIFAYTYETLADGKMYGKILLVEEPHVTIPKENILMCSYFNRVRLDSDELQLNYESNEVATSTLVMKEVDE